MSNIDKKTTSKIGRPKKWTNKKIEALACDMLEFFEVNKESFQLIEWCIAADVSKQRVKEFKDTNTIFSDAYKKTKMILEARVVNMAQTSRNPAFGIFNLKCNYGYVDKQVIEQKTEVTVKGSFAEAIKEIGDVK